MPAEHTISFSFYSKKIIMFPRNRVTGVRGGRIQTEHRSQDQLAYSAQRSPLTDKHQVQATMGGSSVSTSGSNSMSVNSYWNSQYVYWFTNLIPADPNYTDSAQLALFYRDIYLHDSTAGSVVDIQSSFPFSNYDLRGLDDAKLKVYYDNLSQLNLLEMMPHISTAYLVDGYFCGSLVYDEKSRRFLDTLVHDALQCQVIPTPFFNMMPEINVRTSPYTQQLLNSDSAFSREYLSMLPQAFIDLLRKGEFTLNPITTLFIARRSLTDRAYQSFLHRVLPMYLIEKTMYRGTLVEAARRQRATTHITGGDDIWTPSGEELQALVSQFQQAEFDPLGGWVATRNAVNVNDIRPGGDFWKWTDVSDTMVAYKLRALCTSESFLSGEASYAAAESAYSTFLESQDTYRRHLTHSTFDSVLFPLIAVANGLYKDGTKEDEKMRSRNQVSKYLLHSTNRDRLAMPELVWHKSLESKDSENTFELLEQASEKGVPIPLKSWMAAAGLSVESLMKDMKSDKELRARLEQFTGKDTSHEGEEQVEASTRIKAAKRLTTAPLGAAPLKKSLWSRFEDFSEPEMYILSRTGKKKHVFNNPRGKTRDHNAMVAEISAKAHTDPEYRLKLKKTNKQKLGYTTTPLAGDLRTR